MLALGRGRVHDRKNEPPPLWGRPRRACPAGAVALHNRGLAKRKPPGEMTGRLGGLLLARKALSES